MSSFARFARSAPSFGELIPPGAHQKETVSAYAQLKPLLVNYGFRPGEQLRIGDLAKRLGLSTTPVREALNRLHAEGFLVLQPHRGFFAKAPSLREMTALYELGYVLLRHAVRKNVAAPGATGAAALDPLIEQVEAIAGECEDPLLATRVEDLLENFMSLAENDVMLVCFRNFHERTHYLRALQLQRPMQGRRRLGDLQTLIATIRKGDTGSALAVLDGHWHWKIEALPDLVKDAVSRHYR